MKRSQTARELGNDLYEGLYRERGQMTSKLTFPKRHFVSACVLVRDSSTILPEFLVRNYLAGVDHFFIYGDDKDEVELENLRNILHRFRRIVTYLPDGRTIPEDMQVNTNYTQMRIYRHCAATFGAQTHWMAFIDVDEMIETTADTRNTAFLQEILVEHDTHPVLCIRWRSVLTNGHVLPPSTTRHVPLFDSYSTSCQEIINNKIKLSLRKTILQPQYLDLDATPKLDVALHKGFRLKAPYERFHCIWGPGSKIIPPLYLAHYWSRSVYDYLEKIERGRPRAGVPSRTLRDLIEREKVCKADPHTEIKEERKRLVRKYSRIFDELIPAPVFNRHKFSRFVQQLSNTDDSALCQRRTLKLLGYMVDGRELSVERYCQQRTEPTEVCSKERGEEKSWPFAWIEFISTRCDEEMEREDEMFIVAN